jgi:predicted HD superfamily hydrolase involved in NAD metabolism
MIAPPPSPSALEEVLSATLSPARARHVAGVARAAADLAARFGVSQELTRLAALAHDLWRERAGAELLAEARRRGLTLYPLEEEEPLLLHGRVLAEAMAERGWPTEVVEAVRVHTTAGPGMGPVAEVLYVADKIEPGRDYPGVEELRRRALGGSLAEAAGAVLRAELAYLVTRGLPLHPWTLAAYEERAAGGWA